MENEIIKVTRPVDMREIFSSKSPALARFMPGFVYSLINRIMHIDVVNKIIANYGHLQGVDFVRAVVEDFDVTEEILGAENIPSDGRYIFVGNHPLGGFDSMLLMDIVNRHLGDFRFLVNDVLMNIPNLLPVFIPVNKHGRNDREAAVQLAEIYSSNKQVLIFPSGYASRKIKGQIMDLPWQKHFITKSIQYQRDVIPVFIGGKNSRHFYAIANLRKFFRIKWNLEMFLLPDETFRHRKTKVILYFGKPVSYKLFDKSKTPVQWAEYVKERVYELPKLMQK